MDIFWNYTFVLAAMLEGILLPSNLAAKNTVCAYLVEHRDYIHSYAQMCFKCYYHIIFSTISLKLKCKISVAKEIIHSFKNHILVT